ncbi:chemotaxis protein CheW [Sphingomonas elodea]|nr:chemotaxis protein CheW [Sphingomonas elodea]
MAQKARTRQRREDTPAGAEKSLAVRQFVRFAIEGQSFAADMAVVREIIRLPEVVRVPLAPPALDGIANLRGDVLPIVSLRQMLGLAERPRDEASRAMVVQLGQPLGFVVDRVSSVASIAEERIEPAGESQSVIDSRFLAGMIRDADGRGITLIVDFARLAAEAFAETGAAAQTSLRGSAGVAERSIARAEGEIGDETRLVSFQLDGQEYGIAIADVREIVHSPETIVAVPGAEPHVLGLMTLRNRLLPLVDLRSLLGLPLRPLDEKSRIVVLKIGEESVGLAVDTVTEVLGVPRAVIEPLPSLLARGRGEIAQVCRLDEGRRLVSVVDSKALFAHPAIQAAGQLGEEEAAAEQAETAAAADDQGQLIVFRLENQEFGVPIAYVREIVRVPEQLFRVPRAPKAVEGVINLRGAVLPVLDLRTRLGLARLDAQERQRIMVFQIDGVRTGFIVDHVTEVLQVGTEAIEEAPALSAAQDRLLPRLVNMAARGRMLQLIDPCHLIDPADRAQLTDLLDEAA